MEEAGKDPIKRASLISSIVKSISVIPDAIVRSVYIRECSQLLQMEEKILVEATAKLIEQARENKFKEEQRRQYRERQLAATTPNTGTPVSSTPAVSEGNATAGNDIPFTASNDIPLPPPPVEDSGNNGIIPDFPPVETGEGAVVPTSLGNEIPVDTYTSYIPTEGNEQKVFYAKEEDLMRMIVRYGEKVMCYMENENGEQLPLTVTEDELQFHVALHRQMLKEAEMHIHDENFTAERYFIAHPVPEISKVAVDLASDRYQLSKYHSKGQKIISDEERLHELVPRLLLDFKLSIVDEEMKHTLQALANPEIANDPQRYMEIMQRYKELHETQSIMAQRAGDRVVLKL